MFGLARRAAKARRIPPTRRVRARLLVEALEDRTLLAVSIAGTIFQDLDGNNAPNAGEGVAAATAYLDANNNGRFDAQTSFRFDGLSTLLTPSPIAGTLAATELLFVSGINSAITDFKLNLNVGKTQAGSLGVALLSPAGAAGVGPTLFTLNQTGSSGSFSGTLTDSAVSANQFVNTAVSGNIRPLQAFNDLGRLIYSGAGNPNGGWRLIFFGANINGLSLNSWSLEFNGQETSAVSDSVGNYAFNDLRAGNYTVAVANTDAGPNPGIVVPVPTTGTATAHLGVASPNPDLVGTAFRVSGATGWGGTATVHWTVTNRGPGAAAPFQAALRFSADPDIKDGFTPLGTINVAAGLNPGESLSGQTEVTLPAGSGPLDLAYLGMFLDSGGAVAETDEGNNVNRGNGLDLAPIAAFGNLHVTGNLAAASGQKTQHEPSLAVNPANPNHLVLAYIDHSLRNTGYGGLAVANSTDGGATWTHQAIPLPAGFDDGAGHPTVAFDGEGNVFVSFMAAKFLGANKPPEIYPDGGRDGTTLRRSYAMEANNGIFVVRGTVQTSLNTVTWANPVAVAQNVFTPGGQKVFSDAIPSLAVDAFAMLPGGTVANPKFGNLYVSWTRAYPSLTYPGATITGGTDIMFAVSEDGGTTWQVKSRAGSPPAIPILREAGAAGNDTTPDEGGGQYNFSQVTVAPNGDVYVAYQRGINYRVSRSTNAGATFALTGAPFVAAGDVLNGPNYGTQSGAAFRNTPVRQIVADPKRPGWLYALEAIAVTPPNAINPAFDPAEISLARSTNNGVTWQRIFTVGGSVGNLGALTTASGDTARYRSALNDDNDNRFTRSVTSANRPNEVLSLQATPTLAVDKDTGTITVIWYDGRRDPQGGKLDVYGTSSTDGGLSFSANFRLTDASFEPSKGAYSAPGVTADQFLGDFLGLAAAGGVTYATWTDTRNNSQDIFFTRLSTAATPAAAADRFEPNDTAAQAMNLGNVVGLRVFPRLTAGGDADFYRLTPAASGNLTLTVRGGSGLTLQAVDPSGNVIATGTNLSEGGQVVGKELVLTVVAGAEVHLRVAGGSVAAPVLYSLSAKAETGDFGTRVAGSAETLLPVGGKHAFSLTAAVNGSLSVRLTNLGVTGGNLRLTVLSSDGVTELGTATASGTDGTAQVAVAVRQGEALLLQVEGATAAATGNYRLTFANLDQFQTPAQSAVFFPTQGDPAALAVGHLNGDTRDDVVAVSSATENPVSVLLADSNGLLSAPRAFDGGTGGSLLPGGTERGVVLAEFTGDDRLDPAFTNFPSYDVTVLPSGGDGTLGSDRRSDAQQFPGSLAAARFDADNHTDLIVFPVTTVVGESPKIAILNGRGNGTFAPPVLIQTALPAGTAFGAAADFNGDGRTDVIVFSANSPDFELYAGNGDGTFAAAIPGTLPETARAAAAADLNGDGRADLVTGGTVSGRIHVLFSSTGGTFTSGLSAFANTDPARASARVTGLVIADLGDASGLELPDNVPDVVLVMQPTVGGGLPQVNFLAGQATGGALTGFADVRQLATGRFTGALGVGNFDGDIFLDVVVAEPGGVRVIYNRPLNIPSNATPQTARNLGEVVHLITPKLAISPSIPDAYYKFTVPGEVVAGSGPQIIDFSALFEHLEGPGLRLRVLNEQGTEVLGEGTRFRVRAEQGQVLVVHVSAAGAGGAGAYTLAIDVLPQLVSVEARALLPAEGGALGGPVSTLVLTFQGDRLNPQTAEDRDNYAVTWAGPDGVLDTADDQVLTPGGGEIGLAAVYATGANTQVSSGRTFPAEVRQTVTLFFDEPLPVGSYRITVSAEVQSADFNAAEGNLLVGGAAFSGHPVVTWLESVGQIANGGLMEITNLVLPPAVGPLDLDFSQGTEFLTQFHGNTGAQLSALQELLGDKFIEITKALNDQIVAAFGPGVLDVPMLILWLDPVSIDLADPQGQRTVYNLQRNALTNNIARAFVEVGGNVEVLVIAGVTGTFTLNIADVLPQARGGAVIFGGGEARAVALSEAIRGGARSFMLTVPEQSGGAVTVAASGVIGPSGAIPGGVAAVPPAVPGSPGTAPGAAPGSPSVVASGNSQNLTLLNAAVLTIVATQPGTAAPGDSSTGDGGAGRAQAAGGETSRPRAGIIGGVGENENLDRFEIEEWVWVVTPGGLLLRLIRTGLSNRRPATPVLPGPQGSVPQAAPQNPDAGSTEQSDLPSGELSGSPDVWFADPPQAEPDDAPPADDVLPVAGCPAPLHGLLSAAVFAAGLSPTLQRDRRRRRAAGPRHPALPV